LRSCGLEENGYTDMLSKQIVCNVFHLAGLCKENYNLGGAMC